MIAVTGAPRTGTSLVMQTLGCLGIELTGKEYDESFGPKEFFPNGAWDLPVDEIIHGIKSDKYEGMAVKLYAGPLFLTDAKLISKLIICKRNKEEAVKSSFKLMQVTPDLLGVDPTIQNAGRLYDVSYRMIDHYLKDNKVEFINVYFEDMLKHPVLSIDNIKTFIGSEMSVDNAVKNIKTGKEV
jgi:hypothetical protein